MAQIEIDASGLEDVKKAMALFPREARAAMSNTLNRATTKLVTYIHEEVSGEYAVKRAGIKKTLSIKKSTTGTLTAEVDSVDRRLKISAFPFTARGKYRIASVKIKKGGYVESSSNPPLFVGKANKTSGKREVFIRTPHDRHKLSFGFTLSIPQMISNDSVYDKVSEKTEKFIEERFAHEFEQKLIRVANKYNCK